MKITKSPLAMVIKCKCDAIEAATMIYGGVSIDEEFTELAVESYHKGGKVEIVNTNDVKLIFGKCSCHEKKI